MKDVIQTSWNFKKYEKKKQLPNKEFMDEIDKRLAVLE